MSSERELVKVVMLPWLGHGHITPFLELAKGLSESNHFICYVCSTPANLSSINNRIPAKHSSRVHLLPLDLPSSPDLPPHRHTTNGLPLRLHVALGNALRAAKPSFSNLVEALQPDLLIHDSMLPWAAAVAPLTIPVVSFHTAGAATLSYFCHRDMRRGVEFPYAASLMSVYYEQSAAFGYGPYGVAPYGRGPYDEAFAFHRYADVELLSTSREMEAKYLDYLCHLFQRKVVAVGALVQDYDDDYDDAEVMEWLARKDEFSSVFVSFGSEYFLKEEEIEAIANGLELSDVNFVWVVRFPKGEEMRLEEALPPGFLERVGERGKIVEKWAPQTKILGHRSIGGFVSHCGWNSFKESISFGVPIIAMPMQHDQPMNAKLALELGVGVEVERDDERKFVKEEISKVIRDVVEGTTGEVLRSRVGELRDRLRCTNREEMEGVAHLLAQLCGKTIV